MSDDLVKRLRDEDMTRDEFFAVADPLCHEAADSIAELEAKLEKAMTHLQRISSNKTTDELTRTEWDTHDTFTILDTCISEARAALAELEDKTDED